MPLRTGRKTRSVHAPYRHGAYRNKNQGDLLRHRPGQQAQAPEAPRRQTFTRSPSTRFVDSNAGNIALPTPSVATSGLHVDINSTTAVAVSWPCARSTWHDSRKQCSMKLVGSATLWAKVLQVQSSFRRRERYDSRRRAQTCGMRPTQRKWCFVQSRQQLSSWSEKDTARTNTNRHKKKHTKTQIHTQPQISTCHTNYTSSLPARPASAQNHSHNSKHMRTRKCTLTPTQRFAL